MLKVDKDSCLIEFDFEKFQWIIYGRLDKNLIFIDDHWNMYASSTKFVREPGKPVDYNSREDVLKILDLITLK